MVRKIRLGATSASRIGKIRKTVFAMKASQRYAGRRSSHPRDFRRHIIENEGLEGALKLAERDASVYRFVNRMWRGNRHPSTPLEKAVRDYLGTADAPKNKDLHWLLNKLSEPGVIEGNKSAIEMAIREIRWHIEHMGHR